MATFLIQLLPLEQAGKYGPHSFFNSGIFKFFSIKKTRVQSFSIFHVTRTHSPRSVTAIFEDLISSDKSGFRALQNSILSLKYF